MQADSPERKPRKSVAFSEGTTIVDSNGDVTESKEVNGGKSSAESHASGRYTHKLQMEEILIQVNR
jgi:translation initiation factor 2 subunit 2